MSVTPKYPVAHPTWYDNIRLMFTRDGHRAHGRAGPGPDQLRAGPGGLRQHLRPGRGQDHASRRSLDRDMVQTFLNWLTDGCPKGTPAPDQVVRRSPLRRRRTRRTRIRKDVNSLSAAELATLKNGVHGDPRQGPFRPEQLFRPGGHHWLPAPLYCQHHVPALQPVASGVPARLRERAALRSRMRERHPAVLGHHDAVSRKF